MSKTGEWNLDIVENSQKPFKKNSKFQKRHYEEFAKVFKGIATSHNTPSGYYHCNIELMILSFCELFIDDNSQFKVDTFLDAIELNKKAKNNILDLIKEKNA
tara:strand:+ start:149 stop:454 length:306 start_codon:yes stop_codon:yes gene_type:complete